MSRTQVNAYTCKLRLLQYGLVDEVAVLESSGLKKDKKKSAKDADDSESEDEDENDLVKRRNGFVKKSIREAQAAGKLKGLMAGAKNPIAAEQRRAVVREFFKDIVSIKKCANCSGYVAMSFPLFCYRTVINVEQKSFARLPKGSVFEGFPEASV
jgi:DNA-directed RNA polymerase I subunit RPA1